MNIVNTSIEIYTPLYYMMLRGKGQHNITHCHIWTYHDTHFDPTPIASMYIVSAIISFQCVYMLYPKDKEQSILSYIDRIQLHELCLCSDLYKYLQITLKGFRHIGTIHVLVGLYVEGQWTRPKVAFFFYIFMATQGKCGSEAHIS
ncbi:hypothetical protein ACJX0J_028432, partial [Zea mays]